MEVGVGVEEREEAVVEKEGRTLFLAVLRSRATPGLQGTPGLIWLWNSCITGRAPLHFLLLLLLNILLHPSPTHHPATPPPPSLLLPSSTLAPTTGAPGEPKHLEELPTRPPLHHHLAGQADLCGRKMHLVRMYLIKVRLRIQRKYLQT